MMCQEEECLHTAFKEHIASQKEINARFGSKIDNLTTQVLHLQDTSISNSKVFEKLSAEFKEERGQTREAIKGLTNALRDIEDRQTERHDKMLGVQQQNLQANLSLLAIFQAHKEDNKKDFAAVEKKVVTSSATYKALVGLGLVSITLSAWFFATMFLPGLDAAVHKAFAVIMEAVSHLW